MLNRSRHRRALVLRKRPKVWLQGDVYPSQRHQWPTFVLATDCPSPLSADRSRLQLSPRWAIACFKPSYHRLRLKHGSDYKSIVDAFLQDNIPLGRPRRGAEHEFHRRVALAVAVLMNQEGIPVQYPRLSRFPRSSKDDHISQPWLRSLLTGHF